MAHGWTRMVVIQRMVQAWWILQIQIHWSISFSRQRSIVKRRADIMMDRNRCFDTLFFQASTKKMLTVGRSVSVLFSQSSGGIQSASIINVFNSELLQSCQYACSPNKTRRTLEYQWVISHNLDPWQLLICVSTYQHSNIRATERNS